MLCPIFGVKFVILNDSENMTETRMAIAYGKGSYLLGKERRGTWVGNVKAVHLYLESVSCHKPQTLCTASGLCSMLICFHCLHFSPFVVAQGRGGRFECGLYSTVERIVTFDRSRKNLTQPLSCSRRGDKRCPTSSFISPLSTNVMI